MVLLLAAAARRGGGGAGAGAGLPPRWNLPTVRPEEAPPREKPPSRARECPGGTECGLNGFCDFRWGTCVCNYGWKGPDCGTKVAPACTVNEGEQYRIRTRLGGSTLVYEELGALACECFRQMELEEEMGFSPWDKELLKNDAVCFVRVDSEGRYHPELQTSVLPLEEETETAMLEEEIARREDPRSRPVRFMAYSEFKQGSLRATMSFEQSTCGVESGLSVNSWFSKSIKNKEETGEAITCTRVVPLHECPESCNQNGRCIDRCGEKECRCYSKTLKGGSNCKTPCPGACTIFNKCSGHGDCMVGFCRCHHGYFGVDCSLTREQLEHHEPGGGGGDKIFMYDLPPYLLHSHDIECSGHMGDMIYGANQLFLERLTKDPARRAVFPEDASTFLVPLFPFFHSANLLDTSPHALQAMEWVRKNHGKFLERNAGHDHMMFFVGDRHSCRIDDQLSHFTHLVHYGFEGEDPAQPCFRPGTDVVLAPYEPQAHNWLQMLQTKPKPSQRDAQENLLFFRGGISQRPMDDPINLECALGAGDPAVAFSHKCLDEYSQGIRYGVYHYHHDKPGVRIYAHGEGNKEYSDFLSENVFGLATIGHGWGMRVVAVVMNGAIPVFLEHKYHQAWSDVMDPAEYGFVGDITDIPDLVEKLRAVPTAELDAKFQKILEIAPAFVWDHDGQAYDFALKAVDKIMAGKRARGDLPQN